MSFLSAIEPEEVLLFISIFTVTLALWVFHYDDER